jgi:hypothetical protein
LVDIKSLAKRFASGRKRACAMELEIAPRRGVVFPIALK